MPSKAAPMVAQPGKRATGIVDTCPRARMLRTALTKLTAQGRWVAFGRALRLLEQQPFDLADGMRAYQFAARHALTSLYVAEAALPDEPDYADFEALEDALDAQRVLADANPHVPALSTLLAYALSTAAAMAQGQTYGRSMTPAGYAMFIKWMVEAQAVIKSIGRDPWQSPLLAHADYLCATLDPNDSSQIHSRFDTLIRADPGNLAHWQMHAFYMLPGWFGSSAHVAATAEGATEACGPQAYARVLLSVCRLIPLAKIPGYSEARFVHAMSTDKALEDDPKLSALFRRVLLAAGHRNLAGWVADHAIQDGVATPAWARAKDHKIPEALLTLFAQSRKRHGRAVRAPARQMAVG